MSIIIGINGAPGTGKSTLAAELFVRFKKENIICEYIPEVAKGYVYNEQWNMLQFNQECIFGEQLRNIRMVYDKVQLVITDAPLLQFLVYGPQDREFQDFVLSRYRQFNNFEIFVGMNTIPKTEYQLVGRIHNEEESKELNDKIFKVVQNNTTLQNNSEYILYDNDIENIMSIIRKKL